MLAQMTQMSSVTVLHMWGYPHYLQPDKHDNIGLALFRSTSCFSSVAEPLLSMLLSSSTTAFSMILRLLRPAPLSALLARVLTFVRRFITSLTLTSACSRAVVISFKQASKTCTKDCKDKVHARVTVEEACQE